MENKIEKVIEFIKSGYKSHHCAYTEFRSEGNGNDIFSDGRDFGTAWALYDIGLMLGIKLEEPEESEFDEEY